MTPHTEGGWGGAGGVRLGFMKEEPGKQGRCRSREKGKGTCSRILIVPCFMCAWGSLLFRVTWNA